MYAQVSLVPESEVGFVVVLILWLVCEKMLENRFFFFFWLLFQIPYGGTIICDFGT